MARIDEIVDGIYRIATTIPVPGGDFGFNQFLIDDERPALIHTGMHQLYDGVRDAVAEVLDPARLEYVILLHFEADECGGIDRFVEGAPASTLACSALSADLNLSGWNYRGRVEGHRDGEMIDLGQRRLRFLETPHVHHWDSMMLFEEATRSLFPSDLFIQPGDQPPVVTEDLGSLMCAFYRETGIFAHPPQQPPPPEFPPAGAPPADHVVLRVMATVDSSLTVSSWPCGHAAGAADSAIGRDTSNVSPQARQRNS